MSSANPGIGQVQWVGSNRNLRSFKLLAMRAPSPRRLGGSRVCLHDQEFERVAYVRVLTGGRAQVSAGRCVEGVAHPGIDAAVTSLRRAFYGLMGRVRPPRMVP